MFRTDGCMPGAQFDKLAEGYGLCLNLGSQSRLKTQTVGLDCFPCVCACALGCNVQDMCVCVCMFE